jgi:hypothetical protein
MAQQTIIKLKHTSFIFYSSTWRKWNPSLCQNTLNWANPFEPLQIELSDSDSNSLDDSDKLPLFRFRSVTFHSYENLDVSTRSIAESLFLNRKEELDSRSHTSAIPLRRRFSAQRPLLLRGPRWCEDWSVADDLLLPIQNIPARCFILIEQFARYQTDRSYSSGIQLTCWYRTGQTLKHRSGSLDCSCTTDFALIADIDSHFTVFMSLAVTDSAGRQWTVPASPVGRKPSAPRLPEILFRPE